MIDMEYVRFSVVTQPLSRKEKAIKLAALIVEVLDVACVPEVCEYHKFENAYRITLQFPLCDAEDFIAESIKKTNRLFAPWLVSYDERQKTVKLIFNRTEHSRFGNIAFNTVDWAHWEVVE